jgi:hypothetical protein
MTKYLYLAIAILALTALAVLTSGTAQAHRMKGWEIRQSGVPPCGWSIASKCKRGIRPWARH